MINIIMTVIQFLLSKIVDVLRMVNEMRTLEKALVLVLFVIPVPFTMEGYLIIKGLIRKFKRA